MLLPATVAVMAIVALAPGLPMLQAEFAHAPHARWLVPIVLTLPSICMIVFAPGAGWLGDRYGRRPLLIGGLIAYSLTGMAPLVLSGLTQIIISRIGVGIAEAIALTLCTTLLCDHFTGPTRDRWLGLQVAVTAASAVVMVGVGGALGRFGWRGPFAIYVVPLGFALLVALFTWEPAMRERVMEPGVSGPFPWRAMQLIWPVSFLASVSFYLVQTQSGTALHMVGVFDPARRGMLIAVATVGTLFGTLVFRRVVHWPVERLLLTGFLPLGLGFVGMARAYGSGTVTAALFVSQFGCGVLLPTLIAWTQRNLPHDLRARGTGIWQGIFSAGQFVSAPMMTLAMLNLGGTSGAFATFGGLNLIAATLVFATAGVRGSRIGSPSRRSALDRAGGGS